MRRIIDCFTLHNEANMLRFRIQELRDVVDVFVDEGWGFWLRAHPEIMTRQ